MAEQENPGGPDSGTPAQGQRSRAQTRNAPPSRLEAQARQRLRSRGAQGAPAKQTLAFTRVCVELAATPTKGSTQEKHHRFEHWPPLTRF